MEGKACCSTKQEEKTSKLPIVILISILVMALIVSILYPPFMLPFMGIFFISVAVLKLLDLHGFAMGFMQYDLIAMRSKIYAKTYPFIELILGELFLTQLFVFPAAIVAGFLMLVGIISVAKSLVEKKKLKCACLGNLIKVPLTTFTLVEDVIMLIMALMILL